jgi:tetratricopeptide (TPR) repeat protein/DNA-binding XRE family transcriptional regulator
MSDHAGGFGARLRACRQSAVLSQQELAERSGLSVRAISDLERGRTRWPYPGSLHRLADALGLCDEARAEFIAAADRRLARAGATGSAWPTGSAGREGEGQGQGVVPRCLPAAVPGFVGRHHQLAALSRVLHEPGGTAVVTAIGGIAGVGKSALAVQWGHQVAEEFPDGQLFVNLRGFGPSEAPMTPGEAVRVFLDALQIPADRLPQTVEGQLGLYRSLLAGKRMLVILDNARDVAQVRPLLPGSPICRVVVTSRSQLTGLTALEAARPLILDVLSSAEARQLLQHRLGAEGLATEPGPTGQIISSCAHLPLALCVIAARVAMTPDPSLAQVAADLAARKDLDAFADSGDPVADVRVAFSWSYRQLAPDAARVFRLAGLHPGPDLERYAVAALADMTEDQAGRILEVLALACMIRAAGPGRHGLHDLLRSYAHELGERQDEELERRAALTGLFDYYLYAAATAMDAAFPSERHRRPRIPVPPAPIPQFPGAAQALTWLDSERVSLVAVAIHAAEQGWPGHATRLSATLFRYLDTQGHYPEAATIHTHACRAAQQVGDRTAEADALNSLGVMDLRQGRYQQASGHFERALALHCQTGNQTGEARALSNLGFIDFLRGRSRQAAAHLGRSLDMFRELGDQVGEARTLASLGYVGLRQGRYEEAADHLQQSLILCRDVGDRGGEARALGNLGEVELRLGRFQHAAAYARQALALFREIGDRISEADALASLGLVDLRQARYKQAVGHFREALSLCEETSDLSSFAGALNGMGEVLLATGRPVEARKKLATALDMAAQAGEKYEQARAHHGLARAYQASNDSAQADHHWMQALTLYINFNAPEADQIRAQLATGQQRPARR